MPDVAAELIYRLRDYSVSERVRVVELDARRKLPRYVVEYVGGDKAGAQKNVPGSRLRGPWSNVAAYDELMANRERIDQTEQALQGLRALQVHCHGLTVKRPNWIECRNSELAGQTT